MSTLSAAGPADDPPDDPDDPSARLNRRLAGADVRQVWDLVLAGRSAPNRGDLLRAGLGLAEELGRRAAAKAVMAAASTQIRRSPGCRTLAEHLPGMSIAYSAQALAGDAALAVFLRDELSPETREALAAPCTAVFGNPFGEPDHPAGEGSSA